MQSSRRGTVRANTRLYSRDPLPPVRTKKRHVLRLEPLEERTMLSTTYNIGPGQPYTTLGSFPWSSLGPGDTVDIHWQAYTLPREAPHLRERDGQRTDQHRRRPRTQRPAADHRRTERDHEQSVPVFLQPDPRRLRSL